MSDKPFLLTLGDPAGIGPEITAKAWTALKGSPEMAFAVVGPAACFDHVDHRVISDPGDTAAVFGDALPVIDLPGEAAAPGQADPKHAAAVIASIETSVAHCLAGRARAVVTNPIAKSVLYDAGFSFPGHTEFLGHLTQGAEPPYARGPVMMLAAQDLRVGLATVHMALDVAVKSLSTDTILRTARVMLGALRTDFGIAAPRLALTGLNPHAGEDGKLGRDEITTINPAAEQLRFEGHDVTDAQPADTLFHAEARQGYDAVLAMYHDQGLIPVKTLDFHGGVNITLGLPIVRTSPDHGTAFGIAGQGIARPDSLIAAIRMADTISKHRHGH